MNQFLLRCLLCTCVLGVLFGGVRVRADEPAADQALLTSAQQAVAAGKWADAIVTLEDLHKRFPKSAHAPDGLVLLYHAYLALKEAPKAKVVGKEVFERWPKSGYVWQVVKATCKAKAKKSAKDAVDTLDAALKDNLLSPADIEKAQNLRFTYAELAKNEHPIADPLETLQNLKEPITADELAKDAKLAIQLYPDLLRQQEFDDTREIHLKIQELLAKTGDPQGYLPAEMKAYLIALKAVDEKRYQTEAFAAIAAVKDAKTPAQTAAPAEIAANMYAPLLLATPKSFTELKAVHDALAANLYRVGAVDQVTTESRYWMTAVANYGHEHIGVEIFTIVQQMKDTTDKYMIISLVDNATEAYLTLMTANHRDQAEELHKLLRDLYARHKLDDESLSDDIQFACADLLWKHDRDYDTFINTMVPTIIELADKANTPAQIRMPMSLMMLHEFYMFLAQANRPEEAARVYEHVQAGIRRAGGDTFKQYLPQHKLAYLEGWAMFRPNAFLNIYLLLAAKASTLTDMDEISPLIDVSRYAYNYLFQANRLPEARIIHRQLQTALANLKQTGPAETELKNYKAAFTGRTLDNALQLVKQALADKDYDTAKRWVDELTLVAPTAEQTKSAVAALKAANE